MDFVVPIIENKIPVALPTKNLRITGSVLVIILLYDIDFQLRPVWYLRINADEGGVA